MLLLGGHVPRVKSWMISPLFTTRNVIVFSAVTAIPAGMEYQGVGRFDLDCPDRVGCVSWLLERELTLVGVGFGTPASRRQEAAKIETSAKRPGEFANLSAPNDPDTTVRRRNDSGLRNNH